ncbi:NAD(P)H-hydrate dehydratase [Alloscardovia theropitheci]|uniref:ADP-dependent (S)-NAD(P)H-hydrate dehydratase n=1 Tax=Alloscardovia theropitheci TaxID=2496842 RepID=A0A4R0QRI3_9BIFI|nr:ADP/ATP-dependent (S)-NAD(P)H-hydrate dehydratase [Alloscardovia theropitheci]TCD54982.1 NAD(P)H-hydrate dehydratase [Alloscardovia theropitheci]
MLLTKEHLRGLFPLPKANDSKYSRGVVGLFTGTDEYPGAGVLSVCAAASCGAGYVRANIPALAQNAVLAHHPEVVLSASAENHVNAWVIGSGFAGLYDDERSMQIRNILHTLAQYDAYAVVDAGALETFATLTTLDEDCRARCVITPHTGEAQRICKVLGNDISREDIEADRKSIASWLARKLQCTVVLKGSPTIVAAHDFVSQEDIVYECPVATHWLATAGTGDILAGIMGAFFALNANEISAARQKRNDTNGIDFMSRVVAGAVVIHSYAGGISSNDLGSTQQWLGTSDKGSNECDCHDNVTAQTYGHNIVLMDMMSAIPESMMDLRIATSERN